MATITECRDALAVVLNGLPNLNAYAFLTDSIEVPAAVVIPDSGEAVANARGLDSHLFRVRVAVRRADERSAAQTLDRYLSSSGMHSIREAIVDNRDLGLEGTDATWQGWENYGDHVWNDVSYLGADVLILISTGGAA